MTMPKMDISEAKATLISAVIGAVATLLAVVISNSFTTSNFEKQISDLESENAALKSQIADLAKEDRTGLDNSDLQNRIVSLQMEISVLQGDKSELNTQVRMLESEKLQLEQEITQLKEKNTELQAMIDSFNSSNINIPHDAVYFNAHAYKVYEESMTWEAAKLFCESVGGHLATVTSQVEQTHIENMIDNGNKYSYWLGATDNGSEGNWHWITGETWSYTNWDKNMPDNGEGRNENYLQIFNRPNPHVKGSSRYKWNDITIDNVYSKEPDFFLLEYIGFICEWDI